MPDWWEHGGNMDATLHHVSDREYWLVSADQNLDNVTLYWNDNAHADGDICTHGLDYGFSIDYTPSDLNVAYWSGSLWRNAGGTATGNHDDGSITSALPIPLGAKSQTFITFGSKDNLNPLPVEITKFNAICKGTYTKLEWTTSSEVNNMEFSLQKSIDAENFIEISKIGGAGNSNTITDYSFNDYSSQGISYYRLKQTDTDNKTNYTSVISCDCPNQLNDSQIEIYPNPFTDEIRINTNLFSVSNVELFSIQGQKLLDWDISKLQNGDNIILSVPNNVNPGTYLLRITTISGYNRNHQQSR
jgi:hypothetical protein